MELDLAGVQRQPKENFLPEMYGDEASGSPRNEATGREVADEQPVDLAAVEVPRPVSHSSQLTTPTDHPNTERSGVDSHEFCRSETACGSVSAYAVQSARVQQRISSPSESDQRFVARAGRPAQ